MNLIFFSKAIWRILVVVGRTSSRRCSPESYVLLALLHPGPDLVWTIWWKWCEVIITMLLVVMMMMMMTPTSSTLSWKCSLQASCWISGNACTRSLIIVTMTNWCRTEENQHHRHHHHHHQNQDNGSPIQRFRFANESIEKLSGVASLVEVEHTINLIIIILIEIIWYLMIIQKCWRWHIFDENPWLRERPFVVWRCRLFEASLSASPGTWWEGFMIDTYTFYLKKINIWNICMAHLRASFCAAGPISLEGKRRL